MIWEVNGVGWDFGREVVQKYKYPNFYVDRNETTVNRKETERYGWHSSAPKKEMLLGRYRTELAKQSYINHSFEAVAELATYTRFDSGLIGPASLMEENENARQVHGDRVIADALSLWASDVVGKPLDYRERVDPPANSLAGLLAREAKTKNKVSKW